MSVEFADGERSKKEMIADELRREIGSGRIRPGEKLSEARLAARFGVSRMPVREALKELETAGFVSVEQRRGTFVKQMRKHDILDLFEVREAVEGMAARLCATRAGNELLSRIDEVMAEMHRVVEAGDIDVYGDVDARLHALIAEGSGNDRLREHYRLLVQHINRGLLSSIVSQRAGRVTRSFDEHVRLVAALQSRDGDAAEAAMRKHVRSGRAELQDEVAAKFAP
ncbi:GntR family transcriptional regulator [Nocardioides carbamazepini]|uniref:GntR family transcriptional regulator n=1 Tax=Nocardioides carbamazepini TaxID=2854259 RepID=UPI0021499B58|nr:GntR family transcriptional regulator [Nocardioides carbamazepini]MCR1783988.1 GntR family transcriptional regulator [Nocardioides carbamazepini]